jgi:transposase InsO family protein
VKRGKLVRTTISDDKAPYPLDRVNRQFRAERPNQLWVSDFTYGTPSQRSPPVRGWSCLSMFGMHFLEQSMWWYQGHALLLLREEVSRSGRDLLTLARWRSPWETGLTQAANVLLKCLRTGYIADGLNFP